MKWIIANSEGDKAFVNLTEEEEAILADHIARLDVVSETYCNVPLIDNSLLDEEFFNG